MEHVKLQTHGESKPLSISEKKIQDTIQKLQRIFTTAKIPLQTSPEEFNILASVILNLRPETKSESRQYSALGTSVLNICVADYLYSHFQNMNADQLTAALQLFCKKETLVQVGRNLQLNLLFSPLQEHVDIEVQDDVVEVDKKGLDHMLSSAVLRIIATIYAKNGLPAARQFVSKTVLNVSVDISSLLESFDPTKELIELVKSGRMHGLISGDLTFEVVETKDETDLITVNVLAKGKKIGSGSGHSKKIADLRAAQDALNKYYTTYTSKPTPIQKEEQKNQKMQ